MDLKSLLQEALKDEFKARAVVTTVQKLITSKVEEELNQEYKDITLFKDGMEFELFAVKADCWTRFSDFEKCKVEIALHYTCKSKLPKDKRERLEQIKKDYIPHIYFPDRTSYKRPITHTIRYSIPIDRVLSGSMRLEVKL